MTFKTIKANYDKGLWTKQMVKIAVYKGILSEKQYEIITGEEFF